MGFPEEKMRKFNDKSWYPMTVAIAIGVVLYVLLTNIKPVLRGIGHFIGFFEPVIVGIVIAYLVNPLAKFYERLFFRKNNEEGKRHAVCNILAFVTFVLLLGLVLLMLIPQLIESVMFLADNLESYLAAARKLLDNWGIAGHLGGLEDLLNSSGELLKKLLDLLTKNIDSIISGTASAGKSIVTGLIAFVLSIYIIGDKGRIKEDLKRLIASLVPEDRYARLSDFVRKCDVILEQYVTHNFLDSLIVGVANAVFMVCCGMPYTGLVSVVVAVFNLIPTFGPIIGWVIGAFLLILVKPWYALAFTLFTALLQTADAYYIKPKIFGDTLGISGLSILIGVIVGGRMLGIIGILLAIPGVAILDMIYKDFILPRLEARKKERDAAKAAAERQEK